MKAGLFLFVTLISLFGFSQGEPVGQYLFTNDHRNSIIDKIAGNGENVFNDKGYLNQRSSDFSNNPALDPFDWMDAQTPIRSCTNCAPSGGGGTNPDGGGFAPLQFNVLNDDNEHNEDIYQAAVKAWATDDTALGQKVIDRILLNAKDDKLDWGNGQGANNPNATYGTAIRYRQDQAYSPRPFDQTTAWMKRNLDAYTLLHERDLYTLSTADQQRLDGWFQDCYNWNVGLLTFIMEHHWGVNWRNGVYSLNAVSNRRLFNLSSSYYSDPPFTDSSSNVLPGWEMTDLVQTTLNNTRWEHADYIGSYALAYNIQAGRNFVHDYFDAFMKFSVFPDGTMSEVFRGRNTSATVNNWNLGIGNYCWITMQSLVFTAASHATAKINGLPGMESYTGDEFFAYETSLGISDYPTLSGYAGSDTKGGPKSIYNSIIANLKYYQQANGSTHGWSPARHLNVSGNPLLGQEDNRRSWTYIVAFANGYFNDSYLESLYKQEVSYDGTPNDLHSKKGYNTGATTVGGFRSNLGGWGKMYGMDDIWANTEGFLINNLENTPPSITNSSKNIIITY